MLAVRWAEDLHAASLACASFQESGSLHWAVSHHLIDTPYTLLAALTFLGDYVDQNPDLTGITLAIGAETGLPEGAIDWCAKHVAVLLQRASRLQELSMLSLSGMHTVDQAVLLELSQSFPRLDALELIVRDHLALQDHFEFAFLRHLTLAVPLRTLAELNVTSWSLPSLHFLNLEVPLDESFEDKHCKINLDILQPISQHLTILYLHRIPAQLGCPAFPCLEEIYTTEPLHVGGVQGGPGSHPLRRIEWESGVPTIGEELDVGDHVAVQFIGLEWDQFLLGDSDEDENWDGVDVNKDEDEASRGPDWATIQMQTKLIDYLELVTYFSSARVLDLGSNRWNETRFGARMCNMSASSSILLTYFPLRAYRALCNIF